MESAGDKLDFYYLMVLDFEAQFIYNEHGVQVHQEILEFPVVIVDVKDQSVLDKYFHSYVKPTAKPLIHDMVTEITGITQDMVDQGIELQKALENLDKFLEEQGMLNYNFAFVTCGDWDLKTCLKNEGIYKHFTYKDYLKSWINVKHVYNDYTKSKRCGMDGMLKKLGLTLEGRHHSGIDDTKNISKIVLFLLQKGMIFFKKYLQTNLI